MVARSVEGLSPQERITYYRAMSAVALRLAQTSDDLVQKASFLDNAARRLALANEVENFTERMADLPASGSAITRGNSH
jgi:hypothetical protein